ncbi:FadR/GntR family transcriptional regulator [Brachybacterium fresconis]|uniref:GntR family transcriptional repressor for pyruvate dehydrogenase complex n=1 Tax=Brachybacterium fresconis TaxID=173363 RepID=A0ABS4YJZ2_9MICO|nr:FCD domain-containing protein [Brachybacterium fresconis]MBP2408238.1 GntR family transcriptional repressor for pyruvate dehydrogenase complex [Brachybacterium fresconis]
MAGTLGDTTWRYLTAGDDAPGSTELGRTSLSDQARRAVLDLIDEQGLGAGDALPSTGALAERFAVSKTVVREALSALAALGIIEIANGRSATVRAPDSSVVRFYLSRAVRDSPGDGFTALMDLRSPLEIRAAQVAARRFSVAATEGPPATEAARARLRGLLAEMDEALDDSRLYPELDLRLHQEIARLSGNRALHGILEAVSTPLFRAMRDLRATRDQHGLVGAEHEDHARIVQAILDGDEAAAAAAMSAHMVSVEAFAIPSPGSTSVPGSDGPAV